MKRILITGASGNVGQEVLHYLLELNNHYEVFAAVRNLKKSKQTFKHYPTLQYRKFDFEDEATHRDSFEKIDLLFLLRPPHLSDVESVFKPLLKTVKKKGVTKIVFLSVQGAEKSKVIPHNKIEKLIRELGFDYIFVRPSYFMQNLTTNLLPEIVKKKTITLPSGKAKFNWIDVKNIGEATAKLIIQIEKYQNQAYEITGTENKNFGEVASLITGITGIHIKFESINPISFYFRKKKEGMESGFALVMTMLHFLPRLQAEPAISDNYRRLTGKPPTSLKAFLKRNKAIISSKN